MSDFDNLEDYEPPRRTHHTHRTEGAMSAGFFGCFGGCLGIAAAIVLVVGLVVGGIVLLVNQGRNEAQRINQQKTAEPVKTAPK